MARHVVEIHLWDNGFVGLNDGWCEFDQWISVD